MKITVMMMTTLNTVKKVPTDNIVEMFDELFERQEQRAFKVEQEITSVYKIKEIAVTKTLFTEADDTG